MKLVALIVCLFFIVAQSQYSSVYVSNHRNCTEMNTGHFVPASKCFLNARTKQYSKHSCESNRVIIETKCSNFDCDSCEEKVSYPLNECIPFRSTSVMYTCTAKKPNVEKDGFYKEIYPGQYCLDTPITEFVSSSHCRNNIDQSGSSGLHYFDRETSKVSTVYFRQENCKGNRSGGGFFANINRCIYMVFGYFQYKIQ
eukprot:gene10158-2578_t